MIVMVSFPDNEHVEEVRQHLRAEYVVLDQADFPERISLHCRSAAAGLRLTLRLPDGKLLDLDDVRSIWSRRIRPFGLAAHLTPVGTQFAWSECHEAISGLWYSFHAFWMNHPLADEAAQRKILQLRVATQVGLRTPETLITNDPAEAAAFLDRIGPGQLVRKAFRNIEEAPRVTALVGDADRAKLKLVRHAPVIFQRFVPAVAALRVTIIGDEVFAALITSEEAHQVDYRPGLNSAKVAAHRLPAEVSSGLVALMHRLGLSYGAIDLRLTPDGEYVFLEINPAGEYLFVSRRTGQPIPQAIAAALSRGRWTPTRSGTAASWSPDRLRATAAGSRPAQHRRGSDDSGK